MIAALPTSRRPLARVWNAVLRVASDWRFVYGAVATVVLARSAIFVFWDESYFDSNQGVIGLMAKHLIEGRAFPVFMYGQSYMLAVEAWLAGPIFLIAGVSVAALKLPLLAMNLAIVLLLLWILERDVGLGPTAAAIAAVFVVLPSPGTTAQMLEASGGIFEPALYVLLLWVTRRRPVWCGLIFGLGFVHRQFTVYGLISLFVLDAARGTLFTRSGLRRIVRMLSASAAVWLAVRLANHYSSAMGPGTTPADLKHQASDLAAIADRFCFDWHTLPGAFWKLITVHWPMLFGTKVQPLFDYAVNSHLTQGMRGAGLLLAALVLVAFVRIMTEIVGEKRWNPRDEFCAYLVLVAALSVTAYVVARCGAINIYRMRYEMLSLLGAVGLAAWYLRVEHAPRLRIAWMGLLLAWAAVNATVHGRLWYEYLRHTPVGYKRLIAHQMDARGIRYATSDYWLAYSITFLTNEQIIIRSDRSRIREYDRMLSEHWQEAVRISRKPCPGEAPVVPRVYLCPP
jgi:hypothetical protein